MRFEVLQDFPRHEWARLAEASGNVFLTPEWAEAWEETLGGGARRCFLAGRREPGGALDVVWPLAVERRGGLAVVRQWGHGPADEGGPACAPEHRAAAAAGLAAALRAGRLPGRLLLLERLPGGTPWAARLGGHVVVREASPVLPRRDRDWEGFLASRSRNFRDQVRRRPRKLAREHDVALRRVEDPAELPEALDVLFELHARRWEGPGAFGPPLDAFHRAWAERALARGWLRLWRLDVDGRTVAAWYGFRFGGAESFYQSGRDPGLDRLGIGGILFAHTVEAAFADEVDEYRLLRGDEEYKGRWAEEERHVETVLAGAGPVRSALARTAAGAARRPRVRRALAGLAG